MLKNSISRKTENVNKKEEILVRQKELPFVILPKAVFLLKRNPETQRYSLFRLIVLLGYLYSLAMTNEKKAKTSYSELKKILQLKSKSTIQELFKFLESEGIVSERVFHFKTSQKTEIILINSMEIPYVAQSWSEEKVREDLVFKVPKLLYILPLSPFSKAVYMYLCSLRQYASQNVIRTTTRKIREALRMKRKNIIVALNELEKHSLIKTVRTKKETRIELLSTFNWSSELLAEAKRIFPGHPLLSSGTNKEPPGTNKEPQGTNKEPPGTNKEPQGTNKEPHNEQSPLKTKCSGQALEDKTIEDRLEDSIEDFIEDAANNNNDGGEKAEEKLSNLDKKQKVSRSTEQEQQDNPGKEGSAYKELYGSNTKKVEKPKLGRANSGCVVDGGKRAEICRKVMTVAEFLRGRYPEFFCSPMVESIEDIYSGVLKVYGENCGYLLAIMYELMARDRKLGYGPETIKNPNGFLISFALEKSNSDFNEFFKKFLRKFDLRDKYARQTSCVNVLENDEVLFERLKSALKESVKPSLYRSLEKLLLGAYKDGHVTVLVCKDRITVDILKKYGLPALEEAASGPVEPVSEYEISARRNRM